MAARRDGVENTQPEQQQQQQHQQQDRPQWEKEQNKTQENYQPQQNTEQEKQRRPGGRFIKKTSSFEAREAAMRAASAARWAEDERFSLENAFHLQLKRVEVWCHVVSL